MFLGAALGLVSLIGYWKVTTPDPGRTEAEEGLTVRKVVRAAYAASFVLGIIQQLLAICAPLAGLVLAIPGMIVGLTGTAAIFVYALSLALRIPDDGLARSTRTVMWGLVCTFVIAIVLGAVALVLYLTATLGNTGTGVLAAAGGCAVSVGFLVFGIWSLVLVFRYRSALNGAACQARATWAAGTPA